MDSNTLVEFIFRLNQIWDSENTGLLFPFTYHAYGFDGCMHEVKFMDSIEYMGEDGLQDGPNFKDTTLEMVCVDLNSALRFFKIDDVLRSCSDFNLVDNDKFDANKMVSLIDRLNMKWYDLRSKHPFRYAVEVRDKVMSLGLVVEPRLYHRIYFMNNVVFENRGFKSLNKELYEFTEEEVVGSLKKEVCQVSLDALPLLFWEPLN